MTWPRAKQALKKLAKGRYFSLDYSYTEYSSGDKKVKCRVYIDGLGFFDGPTFKEALARLTGAVDESGEPTGDL